MKYAFIDYENLNTLDGLKLNEYERIFLFIGCSNNQSDIRITEKFDDEINLTLITVKNISKNNVDFHIAYYLGKLDETLDKSIEFHILSHDQGYDGICHFIQHQRKGRVCCRQGLPSLVQISQITLKENLNSELRQALDEYKLHIKTTPQRHLPVKLKSLRNDIGSRTIIRNAGVKKGEYLDKMISELISQKILKIVDNKVIYLK